MVSHEPDVPTWEGVETVVDGDDLYQGATEMSWTNFVVMPSREEVPSILVTDRAYSLLVGNRAMLLGFSDSLADDRQEYLADFDLAGVPKLKGDHQKILDQTAWVDS